MMPRPKCRSAFAPKSVATADRNQRATRNLFQIPDADEGLTICSRVSLFLAVLYHLRGMRQKDRAGGEEGATAEAYCRAESLRAAVTSTDVSKGP
jgi:hypothetical protein